MCQDYLFPTTRKAWAAGRAAGQNWSSFTVQRVYQQRFCVLTHTLSCPCAGEPELLDDLLDHWSAPIHKMEKYCFIKIMQDMAAVRTYGTMWAGTYRTVYTVRHCH